MECATNFRTLMVTKRKALSSVRGRATSVSNGPVSKSFGEEAKATLVSIICNYTGNYLLNGYHHAVDYPVRKNGLNGMKQGGNGISAAHKESLLNYMKKHSKLQTEPIKPMKKKIKKRVSFGPCTVKIFSELDYFTGEKAMLQEIARAQRIRDIKKSLRNRKKDMPQIVSGKRSSFHQARTQIKRQSPVKCKRKNLQKNQRPLMLKQVINTFVRDEKKYTNSVCKKLDFSISLATESTEKHERSKDDGKTDVKDCLKLTKLSKKQAEETKKTKIVEKTAITNEKVKTAPVYNHVISKGKVDEEASVKNDKMSNAPSSSSKVSAKVTSNVSTKGKGSTPNLPLALKRLDDDCVIQTPNTDLARATRSSPIIKDTITKRKVKTIVVHKHNDNPKGKAKETDTVKNNKKSIKPTSDCKVSAKITFSVTTKGKDSTANLPISLRRLDVCGIPAPDTDLKRITRSSPVIKDSVARRKVKTAAVHKHNDIPKGKFNGRATIEDKKMKTAPSSKISAKIAPSVVAKGRNSSSNLTRALNRLTLDCVFEVPSPSTNFKRTRSSPIIKGISGTRKSRKISSICTSLSLKEIVKSTDNNCNVSRKRSGSQSGISLSSERLHKDSVSSPKKLCRGLNNSPSMSTRDNLSKEAKDGSSLNYPSVSPKKRGRPFKKARNRTSLNNLSAALQTRSGTLENSEECSSFVSQSVSPDKTSRKSPSGQCKKSPEKTSRTSLGRQCKEPITDNEKSKAVELSTNNEKSKVTEPTTNNKKSKAVEPATNNGKSKTTEPTTNNEKSKAVEPATNNKKNKATEPTAYNEKRKATQLKARGAKVSRPKLERHCTKKLPPKPSSFGKKINSKPSNLGNLKPSKATGMMSTKHCQKKTTYSSKSIKKQNKKPNSRLGKNFTHSSKSNKKQNTKQHKSVGKISKVTKNSKKPLNLIGGQRKMAKNTKLDAKTNREKPQKMKVKKNEVKPIKNNSHIKNNGLQAKNGKKNTSKLVNKSPSKNPKKVRDSHIATLKEKAEVEKLLKSYVEAYKQGKKNLLYKLLKNGLHVKNKNLLKNGFHLKDQKLLKKVKVNGRT